MNKFIKRKNLYYILVFLFTIFFQVNAEEPANKKVYQLLILRSDSSEVYQICRDYALAELKRAGYERGANLNVKDYFVSTYKGDFQNIWTLSENNHYDAALVEGTVASITARDTLPINLKLPIIFAAPSDPVGIGLIDDFDKPPKSNYSGIAFAIDVKERLRFIRKIMPNVKKIGLVYADMPQSQSYLKWLQEALATAEFQDLELLSRMVPYIKSDKGYKKMAVLAQPFIKELDSLVDVFISSNDQMGTRKDYAEMIYQTATKPLVGVVRSDVMEQWGATMCLYPSLDKIGTEAGKMLVSLFNGGSITSCIPQRAVPGMAFDLDKAKKFNLTIPEEYLKKAGKDIIHKG